MGFSPLAAAGRARLSRQRRGQAVFQVVVDEVADTVKDPVLWSGSGRDAQGRLYHPQSENREHPSTLGVEIGRAGSLGTRDHPSRDGVCQVPGYCHWPVNLVSSFVHPLWD